MAVSDKCAEGLDPCMRSRKASGRPLSCIMRFRALSTATSLSMWRPLSKATSRGHIHKALPKQNTNPYFKLHHSTQVAPSLTHKHIWLSYDGTHNLSNVLM